MWRHGFNSLPSLAGWSDPFRIMFFLLVVAVPSAWPRSRRSPDGSPLGHVRDPSAPPVLVQAAGVSGGRTSTCWPSIRPGWKVGAIPLHHSVPASMRVRPYQSMRCTVLPSSSQRQRPDPDSHPSTRARVTGPGHRNSPGRRSAVRPAEPVSLATRRGPRGAVPSAAGGRYSRETPASCALRDRR